MPEIIACPECRRQLSVQDALLGQMVKCPACQTTFTAEVPAGAPPPRRREEVPRGRRDERRYEEDEERRRGRRYEDEDEDYDDRPRRRRYEDEDEDYEDRFRIRRRPSPQRVKEAASNKVAAGLCGILIGSFGVHK